MSLRDLYLKDLVVGNIQGPLTGKPSIDKPWLQYYTDAAIMSSLKPMTVYDYLYTCNTDNMDGVALNYFGRKITFRQLFHNIDTTVFAFKKYGVKTGDIVTISMPNTPEAVYMFYALSKIGAIANMVDPRTNKEGIEDYIKEVDSKLIVVIDAIGSKLADIQDHTNVENIIAVSPADSLPFGLNLGYKAKNFIEQFGNKEGNTNINKKFVSWRKFFQEGRNYKKEVYYQGPSFVENRPVVIVHTGGTTGIPKGVMLSNENINVVAYQSVLTGINMQRQHNWLDIMPPFIAYGVGMGLHLPLTIGMETILIPQFDPKKFDELLLKHKPIHMVGVPSYWGTIINSEKLKDKDLSYMIAPTVGGDAMDIPLEVKANEFLKLHGCSDPVTKGYGMTEVTGGVVGTVSNNNEVGSVGIPFVKSTVAIFNPDTDEELSYNQIGEVCITGPNVMLGYYKNEEETSHVKRVHKDGKVWIHSGDSGYMTPNGNLYIVDRYKRMVIRYDGFKIFPFFIERAILEHPAVEACKVVGMPDIHHSQGKLPCAFIVLHPEYRHIAINEIEQQLSLLCESRLAEYVLPSQYRFKDELPTTKIGKVDTLQLEKEIGEEVLSTIKTKQFHL